MKSQSTVSDILEELADKAITHINRSALTSFEAALVEMVDFHYFLIEAYTAKDENNSVFSYAEVGEFLPLHKEWLRQYRRVFERAVAYIGRENRFVERLAHVPAHLLPSDASQAAPKVTVDLLDFHLFAVHSLERWVVRHRVEAAIREGEQEASQLPSADRKDYEKVVINFVAAWEHSLRLVSHIYGWRKEGLSRDEQWGRYIASWAFLKRHLRNTAYLLAVAIWNDDAMAANFYKECLLRWFDNLRHEFDEYGHFGDLVITPTIFDEEWGTVEERLVAAGDHISAEPSSVFRQALQYALADMVVIVSGIVLGWLIEKRQKSKLIPRIVSDLLGKAPDQNDFMRTIGLRNSHSLMVKMFRMHLVGVRFDSRGYGGWLDSCIETLDSMTERVVVPGQPYTPTTRDSRDDLILPWLALLLAYLPQDRDGIAEEVVEQLLPQVAEEEHLETLIHELERSREALGAFKLDTQQHLLQAVLALRDEVNVEQRIGTLDRVLSSMIESVRIRGMG